MTAKSQYDRLSSDRSQFLNAARQAAELTLPYLIREDTSSRTAVKLITPWQSVGAKGVVTLASKLMLALLPPQTSFFKLQVNDVNLPEELGPDIRSELDLSFAKIERSVMESIAESGDRVVVHQALKHLVVGGNALIYMSKDGLKLYPLSRYVVDRDGNGNVIEIVTKEIVSKKLIKKFYPEYEEPKPGSVVDEGSGVGTDECVIYTHVKLDNNRWVWHQELDDQILPRSMGKAPYDANPWLVLRFNSVDGEVYGRGRVEEFLGDLKSLEALSQAIVEGSSAAAKVVFTVSPSSTTKPAALAKAGNGAIIQGRPDDIGVVQVGKTADFNTAYQMIGNLTQRLNEAFLILNVRNSERTTAEEVRMTQLELEQQLGGLFSLLTVEFLVPYLNRKLNVAQKTGDIPRLPQGNVVRPTIVAGINALGRGQDRESLAQFLTVIAQTMGPEAIAQYINPDEVIKRLAASSGIDVLNLVKTMEDLQQQQQEQLAQEQMMLQQQQAPQMAAVQQRAEQAQMQMASQEQEPSPQ